MPALQLTLRGSAAPLAGLTAEFRSHCSASGPIRIVVARPELEVTNKVPFESNPVILDAAVCALQRVWAVRDQAHRFQQRPFTSSQLLGCGIPIILESAPNEGCLLAATVARCKAHHELVAVTASVNTGRAPSRRPVLVAVQLTGFIL
eukprot:5662112-Prymnesium_polylepis.2